MMIKETSRLYQALYISIIHQINKAQCVVEEELVIKMSMENEVPQSPTHVIDLSGASYVQLHLTHDAFKNNRNGNKDFNHALTVTITIIVVVMFQTAWTIRGFNLSDLTISCSCSCFSISFSASNFWYQSFTKL